MKYESIFRLFFVSVVCLVLFSSCKTQKVYDPVYDTEPVVVEKTKDDNNNKNEGKQLRELSEKLGIDLNKHDNIALYKEIAEWMGVPYRYGGNDKNGVDCSGLVVQLYLAVYDKKLYRSSAEICEKNCKKISKDDLKTGDLVFFATGRDKKRVSHVGLFLKDSKFVHSSSSRGVVISNLEDKYYLNTYLSCGKVQ